MCKVSNCYPETCMHCQPYGPVAPVPDQEKIDALLKEINGPSCSRCGVNLVVVTKRKYVMGKNSLEEICRNCERVPKDLTNVFHELGFPEVVRDRSEPGYVWRDKG